VFKHTKLKFFLSFVLYLFQSIKPLNMKFKILFLLLILSKITFATTIPSGNVSGVWSPAGNPYNVTGIITVPMDSTLIIEPGVRVIFTVYQAKLIVNGSLQANGTPSDTVYFSGNNTNWLGIDINTYSADTLNLNFISFKNMAFGIKIPNIDNIKINNCFFKNNYPKIFTSMPNNKVNMNNNRIFNNGSNSVTSSALFTFNSNCIFSNNYLRSNTQSLLHFNDSSLVDDTAKVFNNKFTFCGSGYGQSLIGLMCPSKVYDNVFKNCSTSGSSSLINSSITTGVIGINSSYFLCERDSFLANNNIAGVIHITKCDSAIINNCYFKSNHSTSTISSPSTIVGRSLYNEERSNIYIFNTIFKDALQSSCRFWSKNNVYIDRCQFLNNKKYQVYSTGKTKITNTLFANNTGTCVSVTGTNFDSPSGGNYILDPDVSFKISNCTFAKNLYDPEYEAVGIDLTSVLDSRIINCIFSDLPYTQVKPISINWYIPVPPQTITNINYCHFYNLGSNSIHTLSYVNGNYTNFNFDNNTFGNPLFLNPSTSINDELDSYGVQPNYDNYNYRLSPISPLINSGNNSALGIDVGAVDLDNQNRIVGDTIDKGAYEKSLAPEIYPKQSQYSFCINSNATVQPVIYGATEFQYFWYKNNLLLNSSNSFLQFPSISPLDTGNYKLVVSNSFGSDSILFNIGIVVFPIAPIITAIGPTSICEGQSVTLTGNTNGVWSTNNGSFNLNVTTSGNYFVRQSNICGIDSSNIITVSVIQYPVAINVGATLGNFILCPGDTINLQGNYLGEWNTGSSDFFLDVFEPGVYYSVVSNMCGSDTSNLLTITFVDLPQAPTISAQGPSTFCQGSSVQLTGNTGGLNVWNNNSIAHDILVYSPGSYYLIASGYCGVDTSNVIEVIVNPIPNSQITLNGFSLVASESGIDYQWINCSNSYSIIENENNQTFAIPNSDQYAVIVSQNGCVDTSVCINVTITNTTENKGNVNDKINIFPNPVENELSIQLLDELIVYPLKFTIIDLVGKEIISDYLYTKNSTINVQNFSNGIYFLKMDTVAYKFIKE
jgi:hypothetical protein